MKVKDLVAKLQLLDQELVVMVGSCDVYDCGEPRVNDWCEGEDNVVEIVPATISPVKEG